MDADLKSRGPSALMTRVAQGLIAVAVVALLASLWSISANQDRFRVLSAVHHADPRGHWGRLDFVSDEMTSVNLPYFLEDGAFRVTFESNATHLDLDLWAQDCVVRAFVDGKLVFEETEGCKRCEIFSKNPRRRCPLLHLTADLSDGRTHVLAVRTKNKPDKDIDSRRDSKLFWVQHEGNAFGARFIALLCFVVLATCGWSRWRHGTFTHNLLRFAAFASRRRAFLVLVAVTIITRLIVAPGMITTDVSQSAMLYAEDLVQRDNFHFAHLLPEYAAAKYDGASHMHKPPGVYYQYAIPRVLFGFSDIYYRYLTRVPPLLGDILIAWVLLVVIGSRRNEESGVIAAAVYLLNAGVFATDAILARPDSLAIALLMLAMVDTRSVRFSIFLGLAVAWKHLALLVTPWFAFQRESLRRLVIAAAVTLLLCAPYLLDDPVLFLQRLTLPQLEKGVTGLVWIENLYALGWSPERVAALGRVLTVGFMVSVIALPFITRPDAFGMVAITFALFVVCAKNVHEHYILWSIPAMLITYVTTRRLSILIAILIATLSMAFHHEGQREIGNDIGVTWSALLALSYAIAAAQMIWDARKRRGDTTETPLA